jgi:two-component system phosphate regulon sensor histidine kinase PhoR
MFYTIRWKLTLSFVLVALAAIGLLGLYLSHWADGYYVRALTGDLVSDSRLVGRLSVPLLNDPAELGAFAGKVSRDQGLRVTIVRPDGTVVADSHHDPTTMENHRNRAEISQALKSGSGTSIRYSKTIRTRMLYVATRIGSPERPLGVSRVSKSLEQVDRALGTIHNVFLLGGILAVLIAGVAGAWVANRISLPIHEMSAVARRMALGELEHSIRVPDGPHNEIDDLAATLNAASVELRRMMNELTSEKTKLQTILDRTDDGIMVVGHDSRVQMANPAAAEHLGIAPEVLPGRTVIESTLSHDLAKLVERVQESAEPASLEIELAQPEGAFLNVYVAPLGDAGAIVVMHDLTAAKRGDMLRRDFVANVSHELRTPLATIKAMAETIVLRAKKDPQIADDFARKIMNEADRLAAISDDLLDLSKIEAGRRVIRTEVFVLSEVVGGTAASFAHRAEEKGIELAIEIPSGLKVSADADATHQILTNLVDNAIKYTGHGGRVSVSAEEQNGSVAVHVSDTGMGIPAEDLPRIFERFYRVDKARSRDSGGTGLGLSIVKHLVEAHSGRVSVESQPGVGTTFTFTLAQPPM